MSFVAAFLALLFLSGSAALLDKSLANLSFIGFNASYGWFNLSLSGRVQFWKYLGQVCSWCLFFLLLLSHLQFFLIIDKDASMFLIVCFVESDARFCQQGLAFVCLPHRWFNIHYQSHVLKVLLSCLISVPER